VAVEFGVALAIGVVKAVSVEEVDIALDVIACNAVEPIGGEQDKLSFTLVLISKII
jgi:hypothetical protein